MAVLKIRHRLGIRFKITLIIYVATLTVVIIGLGLFYFFINNLLQDTVKQDRFRNAQLLAGSVDSAVSEQMNDLHSYASRPLWIDLIKEANLKYQNMDSPNMSSYFTEMEKKWINGSEDNLIIKEYLGNRVSSSMQDVVQLRGNICELFITDRFGGLVAASNKTSDFYQADEEWWKEAFNAGKGKDFLGDIEFDQSSNKLSIPFAVPIKDKSGNLIGICKAVVDINTFFTPIRDFSIGKTGHAILVNYNGDILVHKGIKPLSVNFSNKEDFQRIMDSKGRFGVVNNPHIHKGKIFFIYAPVQSPLLLGEGIFWYVFIDQDVKELFAPLRALIFYLLILFPILIMVMVPIGFFLGGIFVKPIQQLDAATLQIIKGNWDYPIKIKTGDEIEKFANTFQEMIFNIKSKHEELLKTKRELEDLSSGLEEKVKLRTEELTDAQGASLNILEDLTEANKKLEEALKIKSAFTSTVSHELRTPLTAIKESIAIVLEGAAGDINKQQMEFLGMAKNNVDRLTRLINDILDFQKLEAGKMEFKIKENDINNVIEEVYKIMLPLTDKKNLGLILNLANDLPRIQSDRDKLIQVLSNLINNAIKFTEKGSIAITTERSDNTIKVTVRDTGPGIKKENIPKLFQQFEQLKTGGERKTGGTGLGLAISKEIIEANKGKIWVESEFGKGASFIFVLPIKERRV